MNILQINTSVRRENANSSRVARQISERLRTRHPEASFVLRDFAETPHPVLDADAVTAMFTPAEQRTPEQAARMAQDEVLVQEFLAADVIVLGVPMYNLSSPVQFKIWIDAITKAGVTFRYTAQGAEGLVKGKKVYVALARGGRYRDTAFDTQVPYIKTILGFIGLSDVEFIYAEGLNMGETAAEQGFAEAAAQIAALFD